MKICENTEKLKVFVARKFMSGQLDNDRLIQLIELCGEYLNIQTPADYAKNNGLSYNGVIKCRQIITLFGKKFVIDNK